MVTSPERTRRTHRPAVEHAQFLDGSVRQPDPADHFIDGVVAFRRQFEQFALCQRRRQDAMADRCGFLHRAQHVAAGDPRAPLAPGFGNEVPAPVAGQGWDRDAARDAVAALCADRIQGALHAVEDRIEEAGAEFDRQGPAQSFGDLAGAQAAAVFIQLRERRIAVAPNDFAHQADPADANLFANDRFRQLQPDQRAVDFQYLTHGSGFPDRGRWRTGAPSTRGQVRPPASTGVLRKSGQVERGRWPAARACRLRWAAR